MAPEGLSRYLISRQGVAGMRHGESLRHPTWMIHIVYRPSYRLQKCCDTS